MADDVQAVLRSSFWPGLRGRVWGLLAIAGIRSPFSGAYVAAVGRLSDADLAPAGSTCDDLAPSNPQLAATIGREYRYEGVAYMAFAAQSLAIIVSAYRRQAKWAWIASLMLPAVYAFVAITTPLMGLRWGYGALAALAITGLVLPARGFFRPSR